MTNPIAMANRSGVGIRACICVPEDSFEEVTVAVPEMLEQLAVPQANPLGQQLPPRLAGQLAHPVAQLPLCVFTVAALPTGTAMVASELMIVVD